MLIMNLLQSNKFNFTTRYHQKEIKIIRSSLTMHFSLQKPLKGEMSELLLLTSMMMRYPFPITTNLIVKS